MSDFKREERYIVVKVKDMDNITEDALRKFLIEREIQTVGCVVTEADWPNYEHVWQTIEQVANGTFDPDEITRLQAENEALRARLAVQFDALTSIAVALKGAGNLTKEMHDFIVAATDGNSEAILLRKQADEAERAGGEK